MALVFLLVIAMLSLMNHATNLETARALDTTKNIDESAFFSILEYILQQSLEHQASDIHIEPQQDDYRVRLRKNGFLFELTRIKKDLALRLVTRLKIMSNLNIAEKRIPQDGRLLIENFCTLEFRINVTATLHGEKIVLRKNNQLAYSKRSLNEIGLNSQQLSIINKKLANLSGLILITGPTGSGKTMTLYSLLQVLNDSTRNIITVEDPIECDIPEINQIQLNRNIGLDFKNSLPSILRQDPDIIMIGEIRDIETAKFVMEAAQTGHLVLSTLHNNRAVDAIKRLKSLGIALDQYDNALSLIISQRLIRKLCERCKIESYEPILIEKFDLSNDKIYEAVGCQYCHHGYDGRVGVFELLNCSENLDFYAKDKEVLNLESTVIEKMKQGTTSYMEFKRLFG